MRFWTPILLLFLLADCATYWKNRRKDMQDVVTVGAETPMYGAAVKIGPLPIGFLFQGENPKWVKGIWVAVTDFGEGTLAVIIPNNSYLVY